MNTKFLLRILSSVLEQEQSHGSGSGLTPVLDGRKNTALGLWAYPMHENLDSADTR